MKYKGVELILDNFREVLKDFSVDIQDVVRSAILDGIDLEKYLDTYKDNPIKLDQIRLGIKEGIDEGFFSFRDGSIIFKIRTLKRKGFNLKPIEKYSNSRLSDKHLEYLLTWYEEGFMIDNLDLRIIPERLLSVYDYGLRKGYPVYLFNNGVNFQAEYIRCCLRIISNNKSVNAFLNGDWDMDVLTELASQSKMSVSKWNSLMGYIDSKSSKKRVLISIQALKSGMPMREVSKRDSNGDYLYSDEHLELIFQAFLKRLPITELYDSKCSIKELNNKIAELELSSKSKVAGRLRKNY